MEIISLHFAVLTLCSVFIYYLLKHKYRTVYLALLSLAFIIGLNFYLAVYVLVYSLFNYYIGLKIPSAKSKKVLFRAGIVFNLTQLVLLKYASFAIDPVFQIFNVNLNVSKLSEVIIPLGVSFFTLQGIGYLVNIKMGWEKPENKYLHFLLYIIYYPKFLSGPIERSNHFLPQLRLQNSFDENQVNDGLKIALFGFFKKVVIANQLGLFVNIVYSDINAFGGINLWIVILLQPLYLYFDFSGYTDIAIGFSKMYGIDLLPNFNRPFLSENITTLWRRMHMSLSLWFNDYVFKQVSFRYRKWGKYASVFAVFLTFTLFGIWHGAGWNFMILGFLQALAINYEFFTKKIRISLFSKIPSHSRIWTGRICTYFFFGLSHVFFFSPDLNTSMKFFDKLFDFSGTLYKGIFSEFIILSFFCTAILLVIEWLYSDNKEGYDKMIEFWTSHKVMRRILYYFITILVLLQLNREVSFIYQMF